MSDVPVAFALGSNLGPRERHLVEAATRLTQFTRDLRISTFIETAPVGVGAQPHFLNAAAIGRTKLSARALLEAMLSIEADLGRVRTAPGAARTVDLDLVLYGSEVIDEPGLVVPHPRFRERGFVLIPLVEIAPTWRDPVTGLSVSELRARL